MTGETDYLSDGTRTFAIHNGHEILGKVTGVSDTSKSSLCTLQRTSDANSFTSSRLAAPSALL